ncbi:MAG: efflux RND transporter periplasmic adaptor subunit [Clostridiales bacterium]|nr:efflux RND transporter periplasmic adaptor subunit [Clostridiales bacterium]
MKIKLAKKFMAMFFTLCMMISLVPVKISAAEGDTTNIEEINITDVSGELWSNQDVKFAKIDESSNYTIESQKWYSSESEQITPSSAKLKPKAGESYSLIINFTAKDGYVFPIKSESNTFYNGIFKVNGAQCDTAVTAVTSDMKNLTATLFSLTKVKGVTDIPGGGNTIVKKVKINVTNPGAISDSQIATAEVGSSASTSSGTFTYKENRAVYAEVSGDVSRIVADEGTRVSNGSTIIALESSSVRNSVSAAADSVKESQLSLESQYDNLDDFTIKSPIDGTIISKDQKAGDTIDSNTKLCTIYDLSYLKITMNVDELDISKVSVGQKVQITADAVSGQTFEGKVTSVNLAGTTTNGVTTYPVEVQITDYGDLLPGMNVDTYIVVNEVKDVLGVPAAAISRGNRVLVQTGNKSDDTSIPSGYEYVEVETGVSSDDFVEIKSGINEGDSVAYIETGSSVDPFAMMMGGGSYGGGGGDAGGGAPGGGPM